MTKLVRAAGGVIVDPSRRRFLVVHRPCFDDWSFPKGKLRRGETVADAALREVFEETGLLCKIVEELPPVQYITENGNLKTVSYFLMQPQAGRFEVNAEVDAVTWLKRSQALALLSYRHDHAVLIEAHRRFKDARRAEKLAVRTPDQRAKRKSVKG